MKKNRYQFVNWFPRWRGFGFTRVSTWDNAMQFVYDWILWFGFWDIRKWHNLKKGELDEYHNRKMRELEIK